MKPIALRVLIFSLIFLSTPAMEKDLSDKTPMEITRANIDTDSEPLELPIKEESNKPVKRKRLTKQARAKKTKKRLKLEVAQPDASIKTPHEGSWHSLPDETKLLIVQCIGNGQPSEAIKALKNLESVSHELQNLVNDRSIIPAKIAEFQKSCKNEARKALLGACSTGDKQSVRRFKEAGANINAYNKFGKRPLMVAVHGGKKLVKYLVNKGAKVSVADDLGLTALTYACAINTMPVVKILLQNGALCTSGRLANEIFTAIILEKKERMHNLLHQAEHIARRQGRVNSDFLSSMKDNAERTLLIFAAIKGKVAFAQLLLAKQVEVNAEDGSGFTALAYAAFFGHKEMVELLIRHGSEVNPITNQNINDDVFPLIAAARSGHKEIVELLLNNGALVDKLSIYGSSALMAASEHGHEEVVKSLLSNGAQVNLKVKGGDGTALIKACYGGHVEIAELLIQHGANADDLNNRSDVLMRASKKGYRDLIKLLLRHDVDFNVKIDDETPLTLAADRGYTDIVELLKPLDATETQ